MSVFDLAEFAQPHPPIVRAPSLLPYRAMFACEHYALRILDMPVQVPNDPVFYVPEFAERFRPFLRHCRSAMGARGFGQYAYLTVDQGLVKAGHGQRELGCHVDGLQGARVQPKVQTDTSFVVSDALPTVFYPHRTWQVDGLDIARDNLFRAFDAQARPEDEWRPQPYEVVECSAYTVHRADTAPHDLVRTFLRLAYSVRQYDRLGNSVNPLLGRLWRYETRETQRGLQ